MPKIRLQNVKKMTHFAQSWLLRWANLLSLGKWADGRISQRHMAPTFFSFFVGLNLSMFKAVFVDYFSKIIDVRNIDLQIKNIKITFFHFYKNIIKNMHKKHRTADVFNCYFFTNIHAKNI